mgnify:CR=1 FL=1
MNRCLRVDVVEGEDVLDTAKAMAALGAEVERTEPGAWTIHGVGVGGFREPQDVIDCGNSGTGVRLIMGSMATTPISATFTGDAKYQLYFLLISMQIYLFFPLIVLVLWRLAPRRRWLARGADPRAGG